VGAAAAAERAEFADEAAGPVRALDREDVIVEENAAGAIVSQSRCGRN
jgi:hypothetical protein